MTPPARRTWRVVATLSCLAALAACGSPTSASRDVASLGTTAPSGTGSPDGTTPDSIAPEDAMVAFAQCMRDEGIDMPDPQVMSNDGATTGGHIEIRSDSATAGSGPKSPDSASSKKFEAANKKCEPILASVKPDIAIDPAVLAEQRTQMLAFSQCMRDHGIDFPDPTFNDNGGVSINAVGTPGGAGSDAKAMEAAQQACSHLMGDGAPVMGVPTGAPGTGTHTVIVGGGPVSHSSGG